jgi:hypothetical protein
MIVSSLVESIEKASTEEEIFDVAVRATSSVNFFSGFAELLSALNEKKEFASSSSSSRELLELFSYGTFEEYLEREGKEKESLRLNAKQVEKLKQLSVVTLSSSPLSTTTTTATKESKRVLSYEILLQKLKLNSVRELEDFLIEKVISPGLVKGAMNQRLSVFEVHSSIGRDPDRRKGRVEEMLKTMREWKQTCDDALRDIENRIVETKTDLAMEEMRKVDLQRKQEEAEKRASANAGGGGAVVEEEVDVAMKEESGSAGGTKRKK